jgi:tetratricopeptide (TPR) repeat protein
MSQARLRLLGVLVGLAGANAAVYWPMAAHRFVSYDTAVYVYDNPMVRDGLSADAVVWAFDPRHGYAANWHPLTWLSHMLDCQLFGLRPLGHLAVNWLLHVANTWLLFLALWKLTQAGGERATVTGDVRTRGRATGDGFWPSALVAALFAVHPLHVESVAWVAERKDLLSGLFWMLAMLAYAGYAARPRAARMSLVATCLALGLLAKPMVVTLPCVLLLLDFWPLGRASLAAPVRQAVAGWRPLVFEKLPLFALVVAASGMTYLAQRQGGAVNASWPWHERLANGLTAYASYLVKAVWPVDLACFYPRPLEGHPAWAVAGAAALLVTVTALVAIERQRRPYLLVGWLWYLGTLVPVSGVAVQVGEQALADRYTYLPLVGIFIMVAWGLGDLIAGRRALRIAAGVAAVGCLAVLAAIACRQVMVWRDTETLFRHAAAVTEDNAFARAALGTELRRQGRTTEALAECTAAVAIDPEDWNNHFALALVLVDANRLDEAAEHARRAMQLAPAEARPHAVLAATWARQGRHAEALNEYQTALKLDPALDSARVLYAESLAVVGKADQAIDAYRQVLARRPHDTDTLGALGDLLIAAGRPAEAIAVHRRLLGLVGDNAKVANNLAWLLATHPSPGSVDEAIALAERNCRATTSRVPELLDTLATAYAAGGRFADAAARAEQALVLARKQNKRTLAADLERRLEAYRAGRQAP